MFDNDVRVNVASGDALDVPRDDAPHPGLFLKEIPFRARPNRAWRENAATEVTIARHARTRGCDDGAAAAQSIGRGQLWS